MIADEEVSIAVQGDIGGLAKDEAGEPIDDGVSAHGRELIQSFIVEIGDEEVAGAVHCHAGGAAEGKASAQRIDSGVAACGEHFIDRVFAKIGDEEVSGPVYRHTCRLAKAEVSTAGQ